MDNMYGKDPQAEVTHIPRLFQEQSFKVGRSPQLLTISLQYSGSIGQFSLGILSIHDFPILKALEQNILGVVTSLAFGIRILCNPPRCS